MMDVRLAVRHVFFAVAVLIAAAGVGDAQSSADGAAVPLALLAAVEGPIGPAAARHVDEAVGEARARAARVLILRLNTPGGLVSSTREIASTILDSPVPVIGYVAPGGAHAASAGTFILYATHFAAMAPATNLGSATPVSIGGDDEDEADGAARKSPTAAKAENDAVAFIRGLADLHGRNADWAEKAVREAAALSATEALALNVVDAVAADVEALLAAADGRTVKLGSETHRLATGGVAVERIEPDLITRALGILSNPNVAFILLMIGFYGLILEFANPGSIGPGIVGAICLILGLYALNQLPLDYAGLALVLLGMGLMVAEAITPTFGVLGIGGLAAFVIGAPILIDTDLPAYRLSWWVIGAMAATSGIVLILLVGYVWRVYRRPGRRRGADMRGADGRVMDWADGAGHVWAEGERWSARGASDLKPGQTVRVTGMDGLTLLVGAPAAEDRPNG